MNKYIIICTLLVLVSACTPTNLQINTTQIPIINLTKCPEFNTTNHTIYCLMKINGSTPILNTTLQYNIPKNKPGFYMIAITGEYDVLTINNKVNLTPTPLLLPDTFVYIDKSFSINYYAENLTNTTHYLLLAVARNKTNNINNQSIPSNTTITNTTTSVDDTSTKSGGSSSGTGAISTRYRINQLGSGGSLGIYNYTPPPPRVIYGPVTYKNQSKNNAFTANTTNNKTITPQPSKYINVSNQTKPEVIEEEILETKKASADIPKSTPPSDANGFILAFLVFFLILIVGITITTIILLKRRSKEATFNDRQSRRQNHEGI